MAITLAFDTSQQWLSVCIAQNNTILAHSSRLMASGQSEALVPTIMDILKLNNLTLKDIDRIVTITGPGSFTGLRIGLATAQGIAEALSIPVSGLDSFTAFATCIKTDHNILVILDSQKQDVYCQLFSSNYKPLKEPVALNPTEVKNYAGQGSFIITGTGLSKILPVLAGEEVQFDVIEIIPDQICQNSCLIDQAHLKEVEPFYLQDAKVTKPTKNL